MSDRGGREGQHLGNYRLTRLLDMGGFAEVYLGEHVYLNTQAAIKVLHARLTSEAMEDFLEEARHLSHLVHPHIIRVLDFGVQDDTPFLVMDYAPHGSLRQRHPKGTPVPLSSVVLYVRHVAAALQYAHDQKLIHRDVKPENMLLGPNLEVLLSDFGIALLTPGPASLHVPEMVGTMAYMAPEQVRGKPIPASDQYALGVVVYEWLCGERPFAGSVSELFSQHLFVQPPPLHDKIPEIPPAVETVVLRALAKDSQHRFEDVRAFATALEEASNAAASSNTLFVPVDDPPRAQPAAPPKELLESASTSPFLNTPPFHLTPLVGREREVLAATHLIQRSEVRLLTVTGPGGVGKTRLALEVAADLQPLFPEGICFVALAPISDPDLVVPAIAQALGLKEGGEQSLFERTSAFLREKRLLLVLDNFEQVVAGAPRLSELLSICSQVKMLVTSRALLHIEGEYEFPLSPLALPDPKHLSDLENLSHSAAVTLLVQRAQALKPSFELTGENASTIAAICMRLDGLPLAIELAAARIKLLPPQALLTRLTRRLAVLTGGRQDAPARQQTLRNTIAWSYDLLTSREQQLFRRLSVFVGGCTLEAAETLCDIVGDATSSVLDEVASLLDKSLLMQIEHSNDEPRLMLLETIREYGLECLAANGEVEMIRDAHAAYYLRLVEQAEPYLYGVEQELWFGRLDREQGNIREALQWLMEQGEKKASRQTMDAALRMSGALWWYWFVRGHLSEGRKILEHAFAESKETPPMVRAKALSAIQLLAFSQNDLERVEVLAHESLALCREYDHKWGMAHALHLLGLVANVKGDNRAAQSLIGESLALSREQGDTWSSAYALADLVNPVRTEGEYSRAHDLAQEALILFRKLEDKRGIAYGLRRLGEVQLAQGNTHDAHPLFDEALTMFKEVGDREDIARTLELLAEVYFFQGDMTTARTLAEESVARFREIGSLRSSVNPTILLAKVNSVQGNHLAAYALYEELWQMGREMGARSLLVYCLIGFGEVAMAQEHITWAVRLWSAAEALLTTIGKLLYPVERRDFDHLISEVRTRLGEEAFAAAWLEGCSMTPEQALAAREPTALPKDISREKPSITPATPILTYPAGLTAREVEVLRLVAQGLSNAQIAERLIISPYTVNAHMRSIYSKLEVSSRIAVMQFATKHHLI
jgi:predicted ATPase/serine/threonine protein kinase/DNA-binding CsgD family transcriptional regulator